MRRLIAVLVLMMTVAALAPGFGAFGSVAEAQQRPRTLLDLFRGNEPAQQQPQARQKPRNAAPSRSTRRTTAPRSSAPAASSAPAELVAGAGEDGAPVDKSETALKVLVVGDFIAGGMADGLEKAFEDVENVVIVERTNGSSGFVRDDFYDWTGEIKPIIEEVNPAVVVMLIGSNDRQAMRVDGRTEKVRTEAWDAEYVSRVHEFAKAVRETNTQLVWVGGPPFRFKSMSADILAFNEFYRQAAEQYGGHFVDIWDGFVDEDGNFVVQGSDINGRTVQLRNSDGINFTKDGRRKIAFYAERQIRQLLGDDAAPQLTSLAPESFSIMRLPPLQSETELVRFNPIRFDDPELDGGSALLGDINTPAPEAPNVLQAKSLRSRLVEDGVPPPSKPGRANAFDWDDGETGATGLAE